MQLRSELDTAKSSQQHSGQSLQGSNGAEPQPNMGSNGLQLKADALHGNVLDDRLLAKVIRCLVPSQVLPYKLTTWKDV